MTLTEGRNKQDVVTKEAVEVLAEERKDDPTMKKRKLKLTKKNDVSDVSCSDGPSALGFLKVADECSEWHGDDRRCRRRRC